MRKHRECFAWVYRLNPETMQPMDGPDNVIQTKVYSSFPRLYRYAIMPAIRHFDGRAQTFVYFDKNQTHALVDTYNRS